MSTLRPPGADRADDVRLRAAHLVRRLLPSGWKLELTLRHTSDESKWSTLTLTGSASVADDDRKQRL
jgi:hypothetical protein